MTMKITEVYKRYQLMPSLQLHQLRVAAVASRIVEEFNQSQLDQEAVIAACLVHDLANIIKFDLNCFPEMLEPEGLAYWQQVQQKVIEEYGESEEQATYLMIEELGVSQRVRELVRAMGFASAEENLLSNDLAKKICAYSDMRVAPWGIVSLEERIDDLAKRYPVNPENSAETFKIFSQALRQIEQQIFNYLELRPEDITTELESGRIDTLKNFDIL